MTTGIIKPSPFPDGTYKRTQPRVIHTHILQLSDKERKACKEGRRGCSCYGHELRDIARYCVNIGIDYNAKSWSIYPIPGTHSVHVDFHNWPEMGMCNFGEPVARRKNYWWDERPLPNWMTGDERGEEDKDGYFDVEA